MGHDKAYRKHREEVHIRRKLKILKEEFCGEPIELEQPHRLSKGKIHCSCPLCTSKVKNLGFKHSDKCKMDKGYGQ